MNRKMNTARVHLERTQRRRRSHSNVCLNNRIDDVANYSNCGSKENKTEEERLIQVRAIAVRFFFSINDTLRRIAANVVLLKSFSPELPR